MNTVVRRATVTPMSPAETYRPFLVPLPKSAEPCGDPVGVQEIAERLGLESRSVHMIGRRGQLPEPDFTTNGFRAWEWRKILWWAGETERLRNDDLRAQYADAFGHAPLDRSANGKTPPGGILRRIDPTPDLPSMPSMPTSKPKAVSVRGAKVTKAAPAKAKAKAKAR